MVSADDNGYSGSGGPQMAMGTMTVTVNAVNDPPEITVPSGQTTGMNESLVFGPQSGNQFGVSDVDAGSSDVTVTLSVGQGTLGLGGTNGLTSATGQGTPWVTITGPLSPVNSALDGTTYTPPTDFTGTETLTIAANDNGNTGSGGAGTDTETVDIDVRSPGQSEVMNLPSGGGSYELRVDGSDLVLWDVATSTEIDRVPLSGADDLVVNGSSGGDTLTVDFSTGNPVPSGGLTFHGDAGSDALVMTYVDANLATLDYLGPYDGSIDLDGSVITYTGLEPVMVTGMLVDLTFNLPSSADVAALEDDATVGNGMSSFRSVNGTFETTTFVSPSNSLTINTGIGDDTVTLTPLDSSFAASISVTGGTGNDVIDASAMGMGVTLAGGDGDDVLIGGSGDDTFVITPGSHDVIQDSGGNDTADFSGAAAGVTVDLDSPSVQTVNAAGDTVQIIGQIENFVGSDFADTIYVDAHNVTRTIQGGDPTTSPGDTLYVDSRGDTWTDTGSAVSFATYASVLYSGIEDVSIEKAVLLFHKTDAGQLALWTIHSDGSDVQQLTDHGWFGESSPTTELVAFGENYNDGIWVVGQLGGQDQLTVFGNGPSWSPLADQIVFFDGDATGTARRLYVMNADGTSLQLLSTNPGSFPQWSPTEDLILYHGEVNNGVWIHDVNTGVDTQVYASGGYPTWSPDGSEIAYRNSADGLIYTMDFSYAGGIPAVSNHTAVSTREGTHPDWCPNGAQIAFEDAVDSAGIWIVNTDGTGEHEIYADGRSPDWMAQVPIAIMDGKEWLVLQQNTDGSWGTYFPVAKTGLAVLKLETNAIEAGIIPIDQDLDAVPGPDYVYYDEVLLGLNYLFANAQTIDIGPQNHDGFYDDPDVDGDWIGVYFASPAGTDPSSHWHPIYETGIAAMALAASTTPLKVVNVPGSPVDTWTYGEVLRDVADYLAWAQTDDGFGRGGWHYEHQDSENPTGDSYIDQRSDQSNAGYATLGLAYAEAAPPWGFGLTIPSFVRTELDIWVENIQHPQDASPEAGGSHYESALDSMGTNVLRTGNILQQMAWLGDTVTTPRVDYAIDYLVDHWYDVGEPGWRGPGGGPMGPVNASGYQAMYTTMKGLEPFGIQYLDPPTNSIDWYADFRDVLVIEQNPDGSWPQSWWDDGEQILATEWALLTLQAIIVQPPEGPDLVVEAKFEEWIDRPLYEVTFTVANYGNIDAPASVAALIVDGSLVGGMPSGGALVDTQPVPPLAAGASYTTTFNVPVTLSGVSDDIIVFADYGTDGSGTIAELNENNNALENTWPAPELDWADSPDNAFAGSFYRTLASSNGARHIIDRQAFLGAEIDAEADGQPSADATGDDLAWPADDEDGVTFVSQLMPGNAAYVMVDASVAGYLNAWIDFETDGDWNDTGEQIFNDRLLVPGLNLLSFNVPAHALAGSTFARFRFCTDDGVTYYGLAPNGEVEDYEVEIEVKWNQFPELDREQEDAPDSPYPEAFWGWDAVSIYDEPSAPIVADDFLCEDDGPITDIHWLGSYSGYGDDVVPADGPDQFHLGIWTDVPAGFDPNPEVTYSHPGQLVWEVTAPRSMLNEREVGEDYYTGMEQPETTFAYDLILPEGNWFYQESEVGIYWLSVSAIYNQEPAPANPWGWLTIEHRFNDGAVAMADPVAPAPGDGYVSGQPVTPTAGASSSTSRGDVDLDQGQGMMEHGSGNSEVRLRFDGRPGDQVLPYEIRNTGSGEVSIYVNGSFVGHATPSAGWGSAQITLPDAAVNDFYGNSNIVRFMHSSLQADNWLRNIESPAPSNVVDLDTPGAGAQPRGRISASPAGYEDFVTYKFAGAPGDHTLTYDVYDVRWDLKIIVNGANWRVEPSSGYNSWSGPRTWDIPDAWLNDVGTNHVVFDDMPVPPNAWGVKDVSVTPAGGTRGGPASGSDFEPWDMAFVLTTQPDPIELDFGDAADQPYPTLLASNGALHVLDGETFLGNLVDAEADGQPTPDASGDDLLDGTDDEDGVTFTAPVVAGTDATVTVNASVAGYLDAWIDFNRDGDWADPGEQIFTYDLLAAGDNPLQFSVPVDAEGGWTVARFRFSTEGGLPFDGPAWNGEVEDYLLEVGPFVGISGTKFSDLNRNGIQDGGAGVSVPDIQLVDPGPVILPQNDDESTDALPLGFTFELYGNDFDWFYINNNGNITFTEPLWEYTPWGFPQDLAIVAPFWADVDTENPESGEVHLATGTSPQGNPFIQVDWLDVGYFCENVDKLNDFTLYIEDDPAGDIVAFFYRNMEWTTGDASGGEEGFGAEGAQIGFDAGDGVNYWSMARPKSEEELTPFNHTHYVFRLDSNGAPSPMEWGLGGWTIFLDDGNGTLDVGETSTVTNPDGSYWFGGLAPGSYTVAEVLQLGWAQSLPGGANASYSVNLGAGQAVYGRDFGNYRTLDFGDAPDPSYPTLLVNNGASHEILEGYYLGDSVDAEADGQPHGSAEGDDGDGNDDEDGVVFDTLLALDAQTSISVTASAYGFLDAWVDFNADGDWADPGEQIFASQALVVGVNSLAFMVPADAETDTDTFARFRFSQDGGLSYDGPASDGEVEDYAVTILTGGRIEGTKWHDADGDGVMDDNEDRLADWTIFLDTDGDGVLDAGELSTPTDPDGYYEFTGLKPGTYTVTEELQAGWQRSYPVTPAYHTVVLGPGETEIDVNFGNKLYPEPGEISGYKWHDVDSDGEWDPNEQALAGWTITLDEDGDGVPDQTTTTATDGSYTFTNLAPGAYIVGEEILPDWTQTSPTDPGTVGLVWTLLDDGTPIGVFDAGIAPGQYLSFVVVDDGGSIWVGRNDQGHGVDNWNPNDMVVQFTASGTELMTVKGPMRDPKTLAIDSTGKLYVGAIPDGGSLMDDQIYKFASDGTYLTSFGLKPAAWSTSDWNDLAFTSGGRLFGIAGHPMSLHEFSVGGVPVNNTAQVSFMVGTSLALSADEATLWTYERSNGAGVDVLSHRDLGLGVLSQINVTALLGPNVLSGLEPLTGANVLILDGPAKLLHEVTPAGALAGTMALPILGHTLSDFTLDGDGNIVVVSLLNYAAGTQVVTVSDGQSVPDVNFGNRMDVEPGSISGSKWHDMDGDGNQDLGEPALPGWLVYLDLNTNGQHDTGEPSATTDANGQYMIANVDPDTYTVVELGRPGWEQSFPTGGGTHTVTVGDAEHVPDINFGNRQEGALDFGDAPEELGYPTLLGSNGAAHVITPGFYLGANVDGEPDGQPHINAVGDDNHAVDDEDGVVFYRIVPGRRAAVEVIASADGILNAWIDFNADGDWDDPGEHVFQNALLQPGVNLLPYRVPRSSATGETTYARFRFTRNGLDAAGTVPAYMGLASDGEVEDYAVVIGLPTEIQGTKFNDLDGDGVKDSDEPGLRGWTIFLDEDRDGTRDANEEWTTTDRHGNYSFTYLPAGTYTVAEVSQAGWTQTAPTTGAHTVTVSSGQIVRNVDFGNRAAAPDHARVGIWRAQEGAAGTVEYAFFADVVGDDIVSAWVVGPTGRARLTESEPGVFEYSYTGDLATVTRFFPDGDYEVYASYGGTRVWTDDVTVSGAFPDYPTVQTPQASLIVNTLTPQLVWNQWRTTDDNAHGLWVSIRDAETNERVWNAWLADNRTSVTVPANELTNRSRYLATIAFADVSAAGLPTGMKTSQQVIEFYVDTSSAGGQYGIPLSFNNNWTQYNDLDGDTVTIVYGGTGGSAFVERGAADPTTRADANRVVLLGTDQSNSLFIRVDESTGDTANDGSTLASLVGDTGIGYVEMGDVHQVGNTVHLGGPVRTLIIGDVADGSHIYLGGDPTDLLDLWAGDVGNVNLVFPGVLHRATVDSWAGGGINVERINRFWTTTGDFGADLTTSAADAYGRSVNLLSIAGNLTGGTWTLDGTVQDLDIAGDVTGDTAIGGSSSRYIRVVGGLNARLDVDGNAPDVRVYGGMSAAGVLDVSGTLGYFYVGGADFAGAVQAGEIDRADIYTTNRATGTVTTDAAGTTDGHLGALIARYAQLDGAVTVAGDAHQMSAYAGTSATGTIDVTGDLGQRVRRSRRGSRRWVTYGLWCVGDLGGAVTVGGKAWRIDVTGQITAPIDIVDEADRIVANQGGTATGDVTVAGHLGFFWVGGASFAGDLAAGSIGEAAYYTTNGVEGQVAVTTNDLDGDLTDDTTGNVDRLYVRYGDLQASVDIEGDALAIDIIGQTTAAGAIHVQGDVGQLQRVRRGGRRRWVVSGIWIGGDAAGAIDIDGMTWQVYVAGQLQAGIAIDGEAKNIIVDGGGTAAGDVVVGGNLEYFHTGGATFGGDLTAGSIDRAYFYTADGVTSAVTTTGGGTDGHLTTLMVRYAALQGAVNVAGDLDGLYAYHGSTAAGTVTVAGDANYLYFIGQASGNMAVTGHVAEVYVIGDLADTSVVARTLGKVTVTGRIQSAVPGRVIRATALGSTFYVIDSTASGSVTAAPGTWIAFDGGDVTAQVL